MGRWKRPQLYRARDGDVFNYSARVTITQECDASRYRSEFFVGEGKLQGKKCTLVLYAQHCQSRFRAFISGAKGYCLAKLIAVRNFAVCLLLATTVHRLRCKLELLTRVRSRDITVPAI